jgi:hypothetical protein
LRLTMCVTRYTAAFSHVYTSLYMDLTEHKELLYT